MQPEAATISIMHTTTEFRFNIIPGVLLWDCAGGDTPSIMAACFASLNAIRRLGITKGKSPERTSGGLFRGIYTSVLLLSHFSKDDYVSGRILDSNLSSSVESCPHWQHDIGILRRCNEWF